MAIVPIEPLGLIAAALPQPAPTQTSGTGFGDMVSKGLAALDAKVDHADQLMNAYVLGDPVPLHQVTMAMEEARIAVELAVQLRERLTESYRSIMGMQL